MSEGRLAASQHRLRGNPFEDSATPLELARRHPYANRLNSLAEKLMVALGDSTTMDTLTGNPELLVDRLIAERDALKLLHLPGVSSEVARLNEERDDLKTTLRAATEELVRVNDELTKAHAEIKRLRAQLPSPLAHELEIASESSSSDVGVIEVKCPYPECGYAAIIQAPNIGLAHRMVDALAASHEEEMEEEPDGEA